MFLEKVKFMESVPERMVELRKLLMDNYSVFYAIEEMGIIVTRVLYSAIDIDRGFLEDSKHIQKVTKKL